MQQHHLLDNPIATNISTMLEFGLIGNPVEHSQSPRLFNTMFERYDIDAQYNLYCLDSIDELAGLIENNSNLVGLNVTSPFKQSVMAYVDHLTPEAQAAEAVNTLFIDRGDRGKITITGDNTDVFGVEKLIDPLILSQSPHIFLLGTGGASKAVKVVLNRRKLSFTQVSRFKADGVVTYSELMGSGMPASSVIIDCTPLGMGKFINERPTIPYQCISPESIGIDLVYSPPVTPFLTEMLSRGATVRNGYAMLLGQAQGAWLFWNSHLKRSGQDHSDALILPV